MFLLNASIEHHVSLPCLHTYIFYLCPPALGTLVPMISFSTPQQSTTIQLFWTCAAVKNAPKQRIRPLPFGPLQLVLLSPSTMIVRNLLIYSTKNSLSPTSICHRLQSLETIQRTRVSPYSQTMRHRCSANIGSGHCFLCSTTVDPGK